MTSPFFGLTPKYKLMVHENIFNMVTYGKGGWTWDDMYNMPIHLRTYYMNLLAKALEKEAGASSISGKQVMSPAIKR